MLEYLGSPSPSSPFMILLMCYLHCTGLRGLACGESALALTLELTGIGIAA